MSNIALLLQQATEQLNTASTNPRLEAELLLGHALNISRSELYCRLNDQMREDSLMSWQTLIERRRQGEPIAYLIGQREFWSLDLAVTPDTLIPRPETERLVELALERLGRDQACRVADLGTGSGAIALALAKERPQWRIQATDISLETLAVAEHNARRHQLANIDFSVGDWCQALDPHGYDMIVSNPPYIAADDAHLTRGDLRHEPTRALSAGDNGFAALFAIAAQAPRYLRDGGHLLLEHGFEQQQQLFEQLARLGYHSIGEYTDYSGQPRVVSAQWRH